MYSARKVMNALLDVPIREDEIRRCHVLGKPNDKGNRPVIVKFKSYNSKAAVIKARA